MSTKLHKRVIVFGGFRTATVKGSSAVATMLSTQNVSDIEHLNLWSGPGDSLEKRFERATDWLTSNGDQSVELHILGHSMGCQLAVKFAHFAKNYASSRHHLGQLFLTAPDPKYRKVAWDLKEEQAGVTSAYDEASRLWGTKKRAGFHFTNTLGLVASAFRGGCRVVYCKNDTVAEWHKNAEIMKMNLNSIATINWIEAIPAALVESHGIRISLEPAEIENIKDANQFHEIFWFNSELSS